MFHNQKTVGKHKLEVASQNFNNLYIINVFQIPNWIALLLFVYPSILALNDTEILVESKRSSKGIVINFQLLAVQKYCVGNISSV